MSLEKTKYIVNNRIRANLVRVSHGQNQLGVMHIQKALEYAYQNNLDLILVVQNANPPVCIVEDFGKFKYQEKIKEKQIRKKQKEMMQEIKQIRLTPTIGDHDLETKIKRIEDFLSENKGVQVVMKFTQREMLHKDIGFNVIGKIVERLKSAGIVDSKPRFEGNRLICRFVSSIKKKSELPNEDIKK